MKPYEKFVENILGAVRSSQGKDPVAATAIIQEALQAAGLMGGAVSPSSPRPAQGWNSALRRPESAAGWTAKARQARPHRRTPAPRQRMPDWMARFTANLPGQAAGRARTVDPATHGPGQFLSGSFTTRPARATTACTCRRGRQAVRVRWS
jgi:hypothetical protein